MRVTFRCGALALEGELAGAVHASLGAIICHPHPQYGGDMHNPIVGAVAGALQEAGCTTLRFNFRGVGRSEGAYGAGVGEVDDVRAAARYLSERCGAARLTLAGYSFGAMVALRAGAHMAAVDRLIAIAPPLAFFDLAGMDAPSKQTLFVVGDGDQYCSVARLDEELARFGGPRERRIIAGADHFFQGHEQAVGAAVRAFAQRG